MMKLATVSAFLVVSMAMAGCGQGALRVTGQDATLPVDEASPAFLDRVASQPGISQNDAMRGVLLLLDGQDGARDFRQRVEKLLARKIVPAWWEFDAKAALTRGQLAYMVYQACKIQGGLIVTLTGPSGRYCLREMQYQRFMAAGMVNSRVTGMEFVAVMARADAFLETGQVPRTLSPVEGR